MTESPISEDKVKRKIKEMKRQYRATCGEEMMNRWGYYDDMREIMTMEYSTQEEADDESDWDEETMNSSLKRRCEKTTSELNAKRPRKKVTGMLVIKGAYYDFFTRSNTFPFLFYMNRHH